MSHDITLNDPITERTIHFDQPHMMQGGTFAIGDITEAWINVTYNYAPIFCRVLGEKGICSIYGKTGAETIPILKEAAEQLGNDKSEDYWEATEGNAKAVLLQMLAMAQMRPDGIWEGD